MSELGGQGNETQQKKEKYEKSEDSLNDLWDIKWTNMHIIGIPEEQKVQKTLFEETIAENLPNLGRETDIQIQEAHRVSNKMNPKRSTGKTHYN